MPGRRKPKVNRARERARDTSRRPTKYFVAKQLVEGTADRVLPPARRRPLASSAGRAPVIGRDLRVRDVMIDDVVTVDVETSLLDAARQMRDSNVGMLPVLANGRLRGIVTDRDLVVRAMAQGLNPGKTPVADLLGDSVVTGRADWTTDQAIAAMANAHVGRLPVTDDHGMVVGVVTLSSLVLRSREQEDVLEAAKEVSRRSARRDGHR